MAEHGFAVSVSQSELNIDSVGTLVAVRRLLRRNYAQTILGSSPEIATGSSPSLLRGKCTTDDGFGEVPFAWFVTTGETRSSVPAGEDWTVVGPL